MDVSKQVITFTRCSKTNCHYTLLYCSPQQTCTQQLVELQGPKFDIIYLYLCTKRSNIRNTVQYNLYSA